MEEWRCIEFEKRLRTKSLFKVAKNMIQNYDRLTEVDTHVEIIVQVEDGRLRGSKSRGQESQRTSNLVRSIGSPFHSSPNHSRLDLISYCRVLAQGRMLKVDLLVSSVAHQVTRLVHAHKKEEGNRCYHHHHLTDLRVSPRVGDMGLYFFSVVSWGI